MIVPVNDAREICVLFLIRAAKPPVVCVEAIVPFILTSLIKAPSKIRAKLPVLATLSVIATFSNKIFAIVAPLTTLNSGLFKLEIV